MELQKDPSYHVEISAKASDDFGAVPGEALEAIHDALDALETVHRPAGARRRKEPNHYSLRAGPYRILYAVDEDARLITIQRIRPRHLRCPHPRGPAG